MLVTRGRRRRRGVCAIEVCALVEGEAPQRVPGPRDVRVEEREDHLELRAVAGVVDGLLALLVPRGKRGPVRHLVATRASLSQAGRLVSSTRSLTLIPP
eukprot:4492074-Pyramimonas_sp.AAC.1